MPKLPKQIQEETRRQAHSVIEKRRRERIKTCLEQLKNLVPESCNQVRLHQVEILENAVEYIKQLGGDDAKSNDSNSEDIEHVKHGMDINHLLSSN